MPYSKKKKISPFVRLKGLFQGCHSVLVFGSQIGILVLVILKAVFYCCLTIVDAYCTYVSTSYTYIIHRVLWNIKEYKPSRCSRQEGSGPAGLPKGVEEK
jgi:hypothetical protein